MSRFCLIDFETASACDLKKAGARRYAEDPTTEILCLGYTFGNDNTVLTPDDLMQKGDGVAFALWAAAHDPDCVFVAHNVAFEKAIWRQIMVPVFGWPDIPDERWHDIMASAAMHGLPLSLDRLSMALGLHVQKDTEGSKLTKGLSKPDRKGRLNRDPAVLERVYEYNRTDLSGELEAHRIVRGLGKAERDVWLLDQRMNGRGVRLDMAFVDAAQAICDQASKPLLREFQSLTGIDKIGSPKFLAWLRGQGLKIDNMQKATIEKLLGGDDDEDDSSLAGDDEDYNDAERPLAVPHSCRRPLEIRKVLGSASIKKLAAMQACVCADGRAYGLLQYHGAGTGRWAGRLLQPQNFPRPTLKVDGKVGHDAVQLVEAVLTRDAEYLRCLFGEPIEAVASGLRHSLIAAPGHLFEVGDYSKIECVIVLALAGAVATAAQVIKSGSAVYTDMATKVFGFPVDKGMLKEYTIGKNIVLGCGFQMGWNKFKTRYAQDMPDEFCKGAIDQYRKEFAPEVPDLWYGLEDAAVRAVWDRVPHEAYGIVYQLEGRWLTALLPSSRKLWYYGPQPVRKHMPWCACEECKARKKLPPETPTHPDIRRGFTYRAQKAGKWITINAYGGLLTENAVQALARDLLVHGLFNSERNSHPPILTIHDEEINEVPEAMADPKLLEQFMTDAPGWARVMQIPVAAECWVGERYRK